MALDESQNEDDNLDEGYGVAILTQKKLAPYFEGAVVDYVESRYGGGFQIRTANAGGCGDSCGDGCGH